MAGLGLGLVFLYYQLLTCPLFCIKDIKNIEIEGTQRLPPSDPPNWPNWVPNQPPGPQARPGGADLVDPPLDCPGRGDPEWPHRLHLIIQEREPVALVQLGEELYYVDRQGTLFKPLSPGDPHNFPVITGLTPEHLQLPEGSLAPLVAQAFQLLEVLKEAPPPLNLENVSEIHVDPERGFTLYANGLGAALDLGFKDYSEKLQKFAQIWPALTQKGYLARIGRINLDYPQRVLITLKGMEETR